MPILFNSYKNLQDDVTLSRTSAQRLIQKYDDNGKIQKSPPGIQRRSRAHIKWKYNFTNLCSEQNTCKGQTNENSFRDALLHPTKVKFQVMNKAINYKQIDIWSSHQTVRKKR